MAYTTINKSTDYFNTKLWSGNGSSQALTGIGHQTDMVWIKSRTDTRKHNLYDVVRGVQKRLVPNDTPAEDTVPGVTAFGTDGFTVGSETDTNGSSRNFVGWSWSAGASAGSSNTDGSITSTVSANTTAGFSIVKYTGTGSATTVGHGLGAIPKMIIIKGITNSSAENWRVFHNSVSSGRLVLNDTDAVGNSTDFGANGSGGTITQNINYFNIGDNARVNGSGDEFIAYVFAEKTGYSKFGEYTGNAANDGVFVYTGFKPAFVMVKPTVTADNWVMFDNKRLGYNPDNNFSYANKDFAENDADIIDLVSNGFKMTNSGNTSNRAEKFIYMAFAEEPLVGSNNIPATAR